MLIRTHLAVSLFFIFLFLPSVSFKILFLIVAFLATFIPDIDTGFSTFGRNAGWLLRFFTKHRGFFHSLTFCIMVSAIFAFFIPIIALPFFLGYSLHLFFDSFTKEGIRPFWPSKKSSSGFLRTGSMAESIIFLCFIVADIILLIYMLSFVF